MFPSFSTSRLRPVSKPPVVFVRIVKPPVPAPASAPAPVKPVKKLPDYNAIHYFLSK